MKQDSLGRHLLIGFGLGLTLYIAVFWLIESRRTAHTPWNILFETTTNGQLRLEISQQSLGLGPVTVQFAGPLTNPPPGRAQLMFQSPKPVPRALPAGECVFEDLTFLPGTVALRIADIGIQILPRTLTIGTNEFGWRETPYVLVHPDGRCQLTP